MQRDRVDPAQGRPVSKRAVGAVTIGYDWFKESKIRPLAKQRGAID
jgi:hypothetical protein